MPASNKIKGSIAISQQKENNMNKEEIKKIVLDYINENGSASYAELQWLFDQHGYDYKGALMSCADACEHVADIVGSVAMKNS